MAVALRSAGVAVWLAAGAVVAPSAVTAQNNCDITHADFYRAVATGTPAETHFLTRVTAVCADGMRIYADSAIANPPQNLSQFIGNVRFSEEGRELTADRATYRSDSDRLDAFGNVFLSDSTGSTLEGDNLVYLRGGESEDDVQLTVTSTGGRLPVAHIRPAARDSTGAADTVAYVVTATRIVIEGESAFRGEGNAVVDREGLHATGQSMVYDPGLGDLVIIGDARAEGEAYELTGESIRVDLPGDEIRAIIAQQDATLVSEDLDLTAPRIHVFVEAEQLERLVASPIQAGAPGAASVPTPAATGINAQVDPRDGPTTRATAVTQDFLLIADSLDVRTPAEVLEQVLAIGAAHGESFDQDSLNTEDTPELVRRDWLEGDTIIATFVRRADSDSAAVAPPGPVGEVSDSTLSPDSLAGFQARPTDAEAEDTTQGMRGRYSLDRLVARGNARSLYRMPPNDSTGTVEPGRLAVHYVLGAAIEITLKDGEVDAMDIIGQTRGFHLEPARTAGVDSLQAPDTVVNDTGVPMGVPGADTTGTAPDTLGAVGRLPDAAAGSQPRSSPEAWFLRTPLEAPWNRR